MKLIYLILIFVFFLIISVFFIPKTIIIKPESKLITEEVGWRIITGYSSSKDETDNTPDITASQKPTQEGVIACPRYYKFSTQFLINGKIYTCWDRMNSKFIHRFDIWFPSKQEAKEWGNKILMVYLIKNDLTYAENY